MPDRDKTIRDLEYLISFGGASQQSMVMQIATEALSLLKEQETEMCDRCGRIRLKSCRQK